MSDQQQFWSYWQARGCCIRRFESLQIPPRANVWPTKTFFNSHTSPRIFTFWLLCLNAYPLSLFRDNYFDFLLASDKLFYSDWTDSWYWVHAASKISDVTISSDIQSRLTVANFDLNLKTFTFWGTFRSVWFKKKLDPFKGSWSIPTFRVLFCLLWTKLNTYLFFCTWLPLMQNKELHQCHLQYPFKRVIRDQNQHLEPRTRDIEKLAFLFSISLNMKGRSRCI